MAGCALHGIGVSRGYAIGRVTKLLRNHPEVVEQRLPEYAIEAEIRRFQQSLETAKQELQAIRDRIPTRIPADITAFIDTHLLMLEDSLLARAPQQLIRSRRCNAEWALKIQHDLIAQVFEDMDDAYLRTRRDDVDHLVARIQRILLHGIEAPTAGNDSHRFAERIVVTDDLSPADLMVLQHQNVLGFVTEYGGPLSHTAILARSLGIPALVGVRRAHHYLRDDELVVIDGHRGVMLAGLEAAQLEAYRQRQRNEQRRRQALTRLRDRPAVTLDGVAITLEANVELAEDTSAALVAAATGVGLYRTEFLFMNRDRPPDEAEQFSAYREVLTAFGEHPVTIRTLDLGADKQIDSSRPVATNPALGLRAIRLSLSEPALFRPQLRAILRASAHGNVRLMLPMLSSVQELQQVLRLLDELKGQLRNEGYAFDPRMPVGGMIEVPAAAICAPMFARHLDFLSIGTNDLIQYTLAIDRIDDAVNYLYDPLHPAVLKLIRATIEAGRAAGIPVSLCGEMAGDPRYTRLLLGLGLTRFSMHPGTLLEVKQIVNTSRASELYAPVQRLLATDDSNELQSLLGRLVAR